MVKNVENQKPIEKILKNFFVYFEDFFSNMYNYYSYGTAYNITKYQKKTKYRITNNLQKIEKYIKKENIEQIKIKFFVFYTFFEEKKKNELLKNKNWLQSAIIMYTCTLQNSIIEELIKQLDAQVLDIEKIEKKILNQLVDFRWDFENLLDKNFFNKEFSCREKAITSTKRKKK